MTVLMYAMPKEIKSLVGERKPDEVTCGVSFYTLGEDLVACCGGVGKVNAAMATQVAIDRHFPDLIINVGLAGCFEEVPIGTLCCAKVLSSTTWTPPAAATPSAWSAP